MSLRVRRAGQADAAAITAIYNHYVTSSIATFEEEPVGAHEIARRMGATRTAWWVAERDGEVLGYAYGDEFKSRSAYRFSLEVSVYLHHERQGAGIGTALYERLFEEMRAGGYHLAIAGISLPNSASIALHEKFGMEKVAHFHEVGYKLGGWVDVGYWQCRL